MKQTYHIVESRRSRTFISVLLAHLLLLTQFTPLFAQTVKVKRPTAQTTPPTGTQPIKGGGSKLVTSPTAPAVAGVTATKTDNRTAAQKAGPGDTINYTVVITNNAAGDATGVAFNDTVDTNTTLVAGSGVLAADDDYNTIGNVQISVPAPGLLVNDQDIANGNNTGMTASGGTTSAQGGTISISSNGSFTYDPPVGFTGTDSFTYTATTSGGKTATATAKITVAGKIWFVNNNGGACSSNCNGRLSHPFTTLANFQAVNDAGANHPAAGDSVFLYESSTAYVGPTTLLNNQKFIGQDASASLITLTGLTQPSGTDPLPAMAPANGTIVNITGSNANAINLGSGNTLRGFTVGNVGTGTKISGTSFGTLLVGDNTTPDVTLNGTGQALNLTTGTFAATTGFVSVATTSSTAQGINLSGVAGTASFGSTSVSGSTTQGILIGTTTAAINFGNTTVTAGTDAVSFQNNSAGTRTFGTLGATAGGAGVAFLHGAGGGNVTVNGLATLTSGAGNTIDIQNQAASTTVSFAGGATLTKSAGGTGVNLNTDNGNVTFGGTLTIGTSGLRFPSTAVTITGGTTGTYSLGTVSIFTNGFAGITSTNADGALNTTNGTVDVNAATALNIDGPAGLTTLGMTLATVNSTGGTNNISLVDIAGSITINGGAISGASGSSFLVGAGSANVTYNGTITNNTARVVDVQGKTAGGTVAFGGAISSNGGTGVFLNNNSTAIINFTGGLSLTTGANDSFTATGGGTVTATQNNSTIINTLSTTAGTALNVANTTIGAAGLTFRSVSSGSASNSTSNGIILNTTGTTAGLTITGNGSAGSGGTIQHKTGADNSTTQGSGIFLSSTSGVSLTRMQLNDFQNFGIKGSSVTGFSLTNSVINGNNGTTEAGGSEEGPIRFDGLFTSGSFPTASISNCTISGGFSSNIYLINSSGTLNRLTIDSCTIGLLNDSNTNGGDSIHVDVASGATLNWTLSNSTLTGARGDMVDSIGHGGSHMDVVLLQNKFQNADTHILSGGGGLTLEGGDLGVADYTYNVSCNKISTSAAGGAKGASLNIFKATNSTSGSFVGTVAGNNIGVVGQSFSGAPNSAPAVWLQAHGAGTYTVLVQNNNIVQYGEEAIDLQGTSGSTTLNASIFGNNVTPEANNGFAGLNIEQGAVNADNGTMNVVVGNANAGSGQQNDFSNGDFFNGTDIQVLRAGGSTEVLNLSKNGSASVTVTNVLKDDNANPANTTVGDFSPGNRNLVNTLPTLPPAVAACTLPPIANFDLPQTRNQETSTPQATTAVAPLTQASDITSRPFVAPPQAIKLAAPVAAVKGSSKTNAQATQPAKAAPPQVLISPQSGTVSANIGTMHAGDSVTINFSVTVNNPVSPLTATQVSNQGTVTGTVNASPFTVQTDDPDVGGTNDPTVTMLIPAPTISIKNATVPEPPSGTTTMAFTVALSNAYTVPVMVNFQTADGTAIAGQDYTATSGTLNFPAGTTVQTVSVTVLHDAANNSDENFFVNLTSPVNGILGTSSGTGTITIANTAGTFLISELRTSGPGASGTGDVTDEFVELYNNTDSPVTVSTTDASAGWALAKTGATCGADPVIIATVPNGTVIPARGHYLLVGTGYSLANYGGAGAAAGNQTMTAEIEDGRNVALFNTATLTNFSTTTRLDAVGFDSATGNNCDLLREGTNLPAANDSITQYSFVRKLVTGTPQDTNDNSSDFVVVSTTPATPVGGNATPTLGAPGPENLTSPIQRNATIKASLIEPQVASTASPNRVRDGTANVCNGGVGPSNCTFGTLDIRRRFKNTTNATVTRLRFRAVDMTAGPNGAPGEADMRLLTGSDFAITTSLGMLTVKGTVLEQPPTQAGGGGVNSTVTVTLPGGGLANGNTIDVHFLLGVQQGGNYRFFINVEALP